MKRGLATGALVLAGAFGGAARAAGPIEAGPDIDAGFNPANQRPLWELGVGVTGLHLPDYRGSDQSRDYFLPLPYVVYRGTLLKADRDGARALLFDAQRVKVDVSVAASVPTRSDQNTARAGMPDLPAIGEIGPDLNLTLAASAQNRWRLDLRLPLRVGATLQRSPDFVGTTFSPNLNLDLGGGGGGWNVGMLTGPLFADRRYNAHFYSVDPAYATAARPAYQARAGYAGWRALASTSRRIGDVWIGAFIRYDTLRGAVFEDSPLVRQASVLTLGFGVSWILAASSELVLSSD